MSLASIHALTAHEIFDHVEGPDVASDRLSAASQKYLIFARDQIAQSIATICGPDDILNGLDAVEVSCVDHIGDDFVSNTPMAAWQVFVNLNLINLPRWNWDEVEGAEDLTTVTFTGLMRALFYNFNKELLEAFVADLRYEHAQPH